MERRICTQCNKEEILKKITTNIQSVNFVIVREVLKR